MSADNWAVCPTCDLRREERLEAMEIDVENAYGKVSVEEFDILRTELEEFRNADPEETFREDYEIWGAEDDVVQVNYRGGCSKCSTSVKFQHEHPFGPRA